MTLREELQHTLGSAYTLERELGGGGMSRVFVAHETALGRQVVVKVLPPDLVAGVNVERFNREILLAARLQHPHIVPVHSAGEMAGVPYYTMPLVEGESLRARLARTTMLPITETIGVLRDVAKALAYAHERGIVHRDIKPDNVLLSGGSATVTDFGIAKAIAAARTDAQGGAQPTLTQIGTSIGTPTYMAPEQAAADPSSDSRADLYSFGCMAYEMLSGRPPFIAKTPQRLLAAHMGEVPADVRTLRPDTPEALADLVMRCLAKDADDRPQRASDLIQVLETVTSGGGHAAMPPVLLAGRGMIRKALLAYGAAFVVVAVVAKAAIVAIGLPDWVFPGSLIVMALGLPVILFTAYVHHTARRAITQTPTYTPGGTPSAVQGTMATIALRASPHVSWRRTWMGGAIAVGSFIVLIGAYMVLRALGVGPFGSLIASGALGKNEKLLVADFSTSAGDSALAPVVTEAFRTALGQSRSVSVMSINSMRDAMRRMQKPANAKVDFALAREMATREGIKAVITGEMLGVGGTYALAVRLISPQSGEELASYREPAREQKDILPAIDRLAKEIRAKIGESLKSVQAAAPLDRVTTPSLEALKRYVQGTRVIAVEGDFARGAALMEEAIALDTGFAMAYRRLGVEYNNRGQTDRAMELLQKAFDHSDRLSDAERYMLLGTYYQMGPKQDVAKSNAAYESLIELQPDYTAGYNNVANSYREQRRWAKAETNYKRVIAIGPAISVYFSNLIGTLYTQGKRDEALRVLVSYDSAFPGSPAPRLARATMQSVEGKRDSAELIWRSLIDERPTDLPTHSAAALSLAASSRTRGHLSEALKWDAEAAAVQAKRGVKSADLDAAIDRGMSRAWFAEDGPGAVAILDEALKRTPLEQIPPSLRGYERLATAYAAAGRPDKVREIAASFERGRQQVVRIVDEHIGHFINGQAALADKKYDVAIRELRAADAGVCVVCALPALGQAYDLGGHADSAIAVFERYVTVPTVLRATDAYNLAGAHKRLGELYEAKGERQKAVSHYMIFLDLWKTADPELQPKQAEVRARVARIRDTEGRK
jgi:eukaryotic-like serine/threonine-protein kinase